MVFTRLQKRNASLCPDIDKLPISKQQRLAKKTRPQLHPHHEPITQPRAQSRKGAWVLKTEETQETQLQLPTSNKLVLNARNPEHFGLIQERLPYSDTPGSSEHIYSLVVQSILWNQTRGQSALPVLEDLLARYPSPTLLAQARESDLQELLQPIGLWRQRAKRLIQLGQVWVDKPPSTGRQYVKKGYIGPILEDGTQDDTAGWEIAHLPGVGAYALDAFRIFARDGMREVDAGTGRAGTGVFHKDEWRTVVPSDKDLKAYLKWRWACDGWDWEPTTGERRKLLAHKRAVGITHQET